MSAAPVQHSTAQILAFAESWFARQLVKAQAAHGPAWPQHREWVTEYLREEVRQRLLARGWRQ